MISQDDVLSYYRAVLPFINGAFAGIPLVWATYPDPKAAAVFHGPLQDREHKLLTASNGLPSRHFPWRSRNHASSVSSISAHARIQQTANSSMRSAAPRSAAARVSSGAPSEFCTVFGGHSYCASLSARCLFAGTSTVRGELALPAG